MDAVGEEGDLAAVHHARADEVPAGRDVARGVAGPGARVGGREDAAGGARVVDAVGDPGGELEHLDLEDVARLGVADRDGTGDDVAAPPLARAPGPGRPEVEDVGEDLVRGDPEQDQRQVGMVVLGGPGVRQGVDAHRPAGVDGQHRPLVEGEPPPAQRLGPGRHEVLTVLGRGRAGGASPRRRQQKRRCGDEGAADAASDRMASSSVGRVGRDQVLALRDCVHLSFLRWLSVCARQSTRSPRPGPEGGVATAARGRRRARDPVAAPRDREVGLEYRDVRRHGFGASRSR